MAFAILLLVERYARYDRDVQLLGDGVNDAPALKRANIGVAMGKIGSDVAKQAADIVLMDDRFASIVQGIEQGRLLFDNLKKTVAYTLTHLLPEVVPVVLNLIIGYPLGLTSLLILSIDLGTELAPAISLAYEPSERDIMKVPPRKRSESMVNWTLLFYSYVIGGAMFVSTGCFIAYAWVFWLYGISLR